MGRTRGSYTIVVRASELAEPLPAGSVQAAERVLAKLIARHIIRVVAQDGAPPHAVDGAPVQHACGDGRGR
ncbi:MAG TPA: hypothetical protein PLD23_20945 [Armatimonadota bacterium]|mgnify:CR=1 FL=1|nr:hypothetical protein [Armatimonadota bacterium]HQK95977.1 hypothetical protein [Armatimonadota bacterium]